MKAVGLAIGLVVVLNAVVIVPAARERATPVHHVTVQACGDHIQGGWRDGELPLLTLPLAHPMGGWGDAIDGATLTALGFTAEHLALLGDTIASFGDLPTAREAWLTMRQRDDSLHEYDIVGAATSRPSAGDGVHCIAPDGTLLGRILIPEIVSNICFGGRAKHQLFITATTSLYSVILNRKGAQWP